MLLKTTIVSIVQKPQVRTQLCSNSDKIDGSLFFSVRPTRSSFCVKPEQSAWDFFTCLDERMYVLID